MLRHVSETGQSPFLINYVLLLYSERMGWKEHHVFFPGLPKANSHTPLIQDALKAAKPIVKVMDEVSICAVSYKMH